MTQIWWVIVGGALLTYATRVAGYLVVARFETLHPRVERALEAVPTAVLITLAVPTFVDGNWVEKLTLAAAGFAALKAPNLLVIVLATLFIATTRAAGL